MSEKQTVPNVTAKIKIKIPLILNINNLHGTSYKTGTA